MKIVAAVCNRAAVVGLALAALLSLPATAGASTLEVEGSTVVYTAAPGEGNDLYVQSDSGGGLRVAEGGANVIVTAGPGCHQDALSGFNPAYRCDGPIEEIRADLGDGPDGATFGNLSDTLPGLVETVSLGDGDDRAQMEGESARVDGGPGHDAIETGSGDDVVTLGARDFARTGAGDDHVVSGGPDAYAGAYPTEGFIADGGPGSDVIEGGSGGDELYGDSEWWSEPDSGDDTLIGNDGYDYLDGGLGADVLAGGDGYDLVRYSIRTEPLDLSLDGQRNDGAAGEGDWIKDDVEALSGGQGDDTLTGGPRADSLSGEAGADTLVGRGANDTLDGAQGDDVLDGGNGDDELSGGLGRDDLTGGNDGDTIRGDEGDDVLRSAGDVDAGEVRHMPGESPPYPGVDDDYCGTGDDVAKADEIDGAVNCERVERPSGAVVKTPRADTGPWEEATPLTGDEESAWNPQVTMTSAGEAVAVWTSSHGARWGARAHGAPGEPAHDIPGFIYAGIGGIASDAAGNAVVAATVDTGSGTNVVASVRPPSGEFGDPIALGAGSGVLLTSNGKGDIAAVWSHDGRLLASVRPSGGAFGPAEEIEDGVPVAVGLSDTGELLVLEYADGLSVAIREPGGSVLPRQTIAADARMIYSGAELAVDSDGGAVVLFNRMRHYQTSTESTDAPDSNLISERPAGGEFGPPVTVPGAARNAMPGHVAISGAGLVTVAYWNWSGYPARLLSAPLGQPLRLVRSFANRLTPTQSALVSNHAGLALLAWQGDFQHYVAGFRDGAGAFGGVEDLRPACDHTEQVGLAVNEAGQAAAVLSQNGVAYLTTAVDPRARGREECTGDQQDTDPEPDRVGATELPTPPDSWGIEPPDPGDLNGGSQVKRAFRISALRLAGTGTHRTVRAKLACQPRCAVRASARLRTRSGALLAQADRRLRSPRRKASVELVLRLTRSEVKRLRAARAGGGRLSLTVAGRDARGRQRRASARLPVQR